MLAPEEYAYGLSFTSQRARYKLCLMAAWHRRAFRALARFAAAGHQLVFVAGNHDADLAFPGVRNELVLQLEAHVPSAERARVRQNTRVARWFWFEPGRAYIEHGHRFDPYTTFHDALVPRMWGRATHLAESFCHVSSRLFVNRIRTLPVHDLDAWKMMDFVRWGLGAGTSLHRLFWSYVSLVANLARRAVREERELRTRWQRRQRNRLARLRAYARGSRLSVEALSALESLGARPISATIRGVFHALYFHHVGIGAIALVLALVAGLLAPGPAWQVGLPLGVIAVAAGLFKLFAHLRPDPDAHPRLGAIAQRIVAFTRVPIVVFGHTHKETDASTGETSVDGSTARWLNPGAWENAWRRPRIHRAGADCTCGLRFARVLGTPEDPGGVDARLVPWCRTARAPLESPVTPGSAP
jgi:predicted phosphodiesterase